MVLEMKIKLMFVGLNIGRAEGSTLYAVFQMPTSDTVISGNVPNHSYSVF